jgi:hypothetical protein
MTDDLYSDGASPSTQDRVAPGAGKKPEDGEGKTTLINSDICSDAKVGDEIVIRIEKVMDKQFAVSYVDSPKDEAEKPGAEMPSSGEGDSEMRSMMG